MTPEFSCYLVETDAQGQLTAGIQKRSRSELPAGDTLIRVHYSSLNYKDAMAATGNRAIAKSLPHVPGIDAAGIVQESTDPRFPPGTRVIATGHELGVERWGGWGELIRVPASWLVPLPAGLTLEEAMIFGTAGFTAAQCVQSLQHHQITPESGPVVVTGATGGVGILSVIFLAQLGYQVTAVTGKAEQGEWLKSLGAHTVAGRDLLGDTSKRPLLSAQFAGAIDTVGGKILATLCKSIQHRGCVACCGVTAGPDLDLTVYPFILRGLTLAGIDSAWCPDSERLPLWQKMAGPWKPATLHRIKRVIPLSKISAEVEKMMHGEHVGRTVIDLT